MSSERAAPIPLAEPPTPPGPADARAGTELTPAMRLQILERVPDRF